MVRIKASVNGYEDWLRGQLGAEVVEADLKEKHRKMRERAFPFLRATYWRWCELAADMLLRPVTCLKSLRSATRISRASAPGATQMAGWCGA